MFDGLVVSLLSVIPRRTASRGMGRVARTRLSRIGIRVFAKVYGVDVEEAEFPIEAYPSLEAFFTRHLRPGARPVDRSPGALVSPVDGRVAWVGRTRGGRFEVAPGREVAVDAILGERVADERDVVVLYLSPRDYHRVHAPLAGTVRRWRYVPGTLWPVFAASVARVPGLFARNERLVAFLDTAAGEVQAVLIGAFGVGRIEVTFADLLTNTGGAPAENACVPPFAVEPGAELGVFHLGSTVVLVTPPGAFAWQVAAGDVVRMGRRIATATGA